MEQFNCVVIKGNKRYVSNQRGIKPLLDFLDNGLIEESFVSDKIIGKAAALLLVYGKAKKVHGITMSKEADKILTNNNIEHSYDILAEKIMNRQNTDLCPMELAVIDISDCKHAYLAIKQKVKEMGI